MSKFKILFLFHPSLIKCFIFIVMSFSLLPTYTKLFHCYLLSVYSHVPVFDIHWGEVVASGDGGEKQYSP